MFQGDKQAHGAGKGSLGKAMDFSVVTCPATGELDKSPAVGGRECLYRIAFRNMSRLTMQVATVWWDGAMPQALHLLLTDHDSNLQTLDASIHHGWIPGHSSNCKKGQGCHAQRC